MNFWIEFCFEINFKINFSKNPKRFFLTIFSNEIKANCNHIEKVR